MCKAFWSYVLKHQQWSNHMSFQEVAADLADTITKLTKLGWTHTGILINPDTETKEVSFQKEAVTLTLKLKPNATIPETRHRWLASVPLGAMRPLASGDTDEEAVAGMKRQITAAIAKLQRTLDKLEQK